MQILIQATVLGASRRTRAATSERKEATYAEVHLATDMSGDAKDTVGQSVTTLRLADPRLVDAFRNGKLPGAYLLVAEQMTFGEVTRTTVNDVRPAMVAAVPKTGTA